MQKGARYDVFFQINNNVKSMSKIPHISRCTDPVFSSLLINKTIHCLLISFYQIHSFCIIRTAITELFKQYFLKTEDASSVVGFIFNILQLTKRHHNLKKSTVFPDFLWAKIKQLNFLQLKYIKGIKLIKNNW